MDTTPETATAERPEMSLRVVKNEGERRLLFARLRDEGLIHALLYDKEEPTEADFLDSTGPDSAVFGVGMIDGEDAAVWWFNGFSGRSCFVHFSCFKATSRYIVPLGRYVFEWAMRGFDLRAVIGLTPACWRHALKVVLQVGFQEQFRVPQGCFIARRQKYTDGVVTMLTPKELGLC